MRTVDAQYEQVLAEDLARLRAALPPLIEPHAGQFVSLTELFRDRVALDAEWDEKTGELELIGIGNETGVVQLTPPWDEHRVQVEELTRTVPVVFHNADSDIRKLREFGFKISIQEFRQLDDTMLAHAVLRSEEEHTLEYLCLNFGKLPGHKHLKMFAPREYNQADVVQTLLIWKYGIEPELLADPAAYLIYRTQSVPFLALAIEGEEAGIRIDPSKPKPLAEKFAAKIEQASQLVQAAVGYPLKLSSPDQLKEHLYNIEELPIQRTRDEKPTTDKDAIATLRRSFGTEWDPDVPPTLEDALANIEAGGHPVLEARYLHFGALQALSHYVKPCMDRERIYPECRTHVQASGRHSYVGPALSQFKGEVELLLTPDIGHCWVGHDWKQIEVRLLAVLANDEPYLEAFARGDDIHEINARMIFGPAGSPELEELRRRFIKAFVFRLHYRGKPENAGDIPGTRALGLDEKRLVAASETYMDGHRAIVKLWDQLDAQADAEGLVRTFRGRPRRLTSPYRNQRLREASNHPLQGGVADIYVETALLVKQAAPWARLVYGKFDSQWWQVANERRLEFMALYVPIVQREFVINGRAVSFPGSFKIREAA